jgi:monoamine oxidase
MDDTSVSEPYDCIIIGSGIAGLYTAVELLRAVPKIRVAVCEKHKEIGGRVYTFHQEIDGVKMQWEGGAGRISEHHTIILDLLRRYKLTFSPIGGTIQYKDTYTSALEPDAFEPGLPVFIDPLFSLPADVLSSNTIRQLLTKIHGPKRTEDYLIRFPYRAEVDVMRADMALELFSREFRGTEKYGICVEGLSAMIEALRADAEKRGAKFFLNRELVSVSQKGLVELKFKDATMRAKHCVLALPSEALRHVTPFGKWPHLKRVIMTPLLRFYGSFPAGPDGKIWYEKYGGRIVTSTPVRYIIPGNAAIGSAHMSYTDTQDARYWIDKLKSEGEKKVAEQMLLELRKLLSPEIPPPTFVKAHAWDDGVTYWLPGKYDPAAISKAAFTPFPTMPAVHVCGESFSMRQGWMEGAVEHAAGLIPKLIKKMRK